MLQMPSTPIIRNHSSISGPKHLPMAEVPNCWATNITVMMPRVSGITGGFSITDDRPSIEVVTVMAGVITPSAIRVLAPMAART